MSAEKKVTTIKGEEMLISKCRKFLNLWYKIGDVNIKDSGDCYLIDGKYYREETSNILFNHSINSYQLADKSLVKGVVEIKNGQLVFGYFNPGVYSKIITKEGNSYLLFNADILKNNKEYRERLSDGNYYHITTLSANKFNIISFPRKDYKYSLSYDAKNIIDKSIEKYNQNYNPEISENIQEYSTLLENLSFGLEFETTHGFIPDRILNNYGLMPLRDGSISGIEYATVPMEGAKGLQCTHDILEHLKYRTKYDDRTCSLHLHLGNVPRTKEFILAFFKVGMMIQDDMYKLFPLYKKYNYDIKNKNYSAPLPTYQILSQLDPIIDNSNINHNFGVLYKYLSMGQSFQAINYDINNIIGHPADPNGTQKWNIKPRYHIFNVIPLLFGNKQTIEFRIHTPTYDVNKIIPFILINSLLVNFVIKYQNDILNNKLYYLTNLSEILVHQIENYSLSSSDKNNFINLIYDIIETRTNGYKNQTLQGCILGKEDNIYSPKYINWSKSETVNNNIYKNVYGFTDSQLSDLSNDLKNTPVTVSRHPNKDNNTISFGIPSIINDNNISGYQKFSLYSYDQVSQIQDFEKFTIDKNKKLIKKDNEDFAL